MNSNELALLLDDIVNSEDHGLHFMIDLSTTDFKNLIILASKKNIKLCYYYDIISCLYDFKINKKSISCYDMMGNKIYLKYASKMVFFSNAITIDR